MKILIVGSDLNAKLIAQYLKLENNEHDIYITTEEKSDKTCYTSVNIKENDIGTICDFVKYNQIEFTIAVSSIAIINGIADEFKKEGFLIFAPFSESEKITYFNSIAKKIMYKLKINTPKFGIFDRENLAVDYIRKEKFPIVIENDFTLLNRESYIYESFSKAKLGIQKIFENGNDKIVIEHYIKQDPVYIYFITDGYNALPLIALDRISGENFTSIIAPSGKISEKIIIDILRNAIFPVLDDIAKFSDMYTGILGIKLKLDNNKYYINEFYNGFQHYDMQAFISLLDDNLLNILLSASTSSLSDNYNYINTKDKFSYTLAVNKTELLSFEDNEEDFIESEDEKKYIITRTASTLNEAKKDVIDFLSCIAKEKLMKEIISSNKEKELRI